MYIIKISKKGTVKNIEKNNINFLKKNKNIDILHTWDYNNAKLVLYGCYTGNAGQENKYDLPPPMDIEMFFDDLYIVKLVKNELSDLTLVEYNKFYDESFKGFEDIDYTDDEEENSLSEHTSDRDFIDDGDLSFENELDVEIELSDNSDFSSEFDTTLITSEEKTSDYNDTKTDESIELKENNSSDNNLSEIEITLSSCSDIDTENDD